MLNSFKNCLSQETTHTRSSLCHYLLSCFLSLVIWFDECWKKNKYIHNQTSILRCFRDYFHKFRDYFKIFFISLEIAQRQKMKCRVSQFLVNSSVDKQESDLRHISYCLFDLALGNRFVWNFRACLGSNIFRIDPTAIPACFAILSMSF